MLRKTLSIALLVSSLLSCSLIYEFRDIKEIEGWRWSGSESFTFTYTTEEDKTLDGTLLFRHVQGFQYPEVSFRIEIESEQGVWDTTFVVPIRDQNGDYLGEGSVDLWDVEHAVFNARRFAAGTHTIRIHQNTADPLPLAMEVGIQLSNTD